MEEKKSSPFVGPLLFVIGFVCALIVGWVIFPKVLYSAMEQPVRFSHKVHVEDQGLDCESCHYYRENGSFAGLPTNEDCGNCHFDIMGEDPAEAKYMEEYFNQDKEVPWLVYQYQPDNVYFSHNAHTLAFDCVECHPAMAENDTPPTYYRNRLTGYSKDTMKMWQCERCHAENGVSNACYNCHK